MSLGAPFPPRNWSSEGGPRSGKKETLMVSERATHWLRARSALFKSEEEDREREREMEREKKKTPMGF